MIQGGGDITLQFDSSGPRAFPQEYRDFLQSVFDQSRAVLNATFGQPANPGTVFVRNYDADIGDRDAVAGGYFIADNGAGEMEIAFPIYNQQEAAAVNFVHTLLLAYQGQNPYFFDAFEEGLVRAATMKVVRTPGSLPNTLDTGQIEQVLENLYDVGTWYDWYNQRALGGPQFIAPNLRDTELPPGGSTGGLYLLRYEMAGSAWQKVIAEHPAFISEFNARYYLDPTIDDNVPALIALGQQVLDFLRPGDPTIEGRSFAQWFRRQFILETENTFGTKLLVQPLPLPPNLNEADYGVFDISTHYFETDLLGNEILKSGTSFPIFWEDSFNRFYPVLDGGDRMSIAGGYGSVTPNFENQMGNPYRVTVDIPVQDQMARVYLPAGAIATFSNQTPNDFYGTVVGLDLSGGATGRVQIYSLPAMILLAEAPIQNGAYGTLIDTAPYLQSGSFLVKVVRTAGSLDEDVLVRIVNKGPGALGLDLRINGDVSYTLPGGLSKGMSSFGLPIEPFASSIPQILGLPANQVLAARFNAARTAYDLFPSLEPFKLGHGYFVRMPAAAPLIIDGLIHPGTPTAVALRPGWNMISTPINETIPVSQVRVIKGADFPKSYVDAAGIELGIDFFTFQPGPIDPNTGAPETGSMVAATTFEAGKMYFVRVLAPEGSSLLFEPDTPLGPISRQGGSTGGQSNGGGWQVRTTITEHQGRSAQSFIGQSTTATRGFDSREDSGLPPGFAGLQVWSQSGEALYRDTRKLGQAETYRMRIEGLRVGNMYSLILSNVSGSQTYLDLYDPVRGLRRRVPTNYVYTFQATGTTRSIELSVAGGGR